LITLPTRTAPSEIGRLEANPLIGHPACGVERITDQNSGQLRIGAITGHAAQVGPERVARIRLDAFDETLQLARLRHQAQNLLDVVERDPQQPPL
jgi:hypothetical protein